MLKNRIKYYILILIFAIILQNFSSFVQKISNAVGKMFEDNTINLSVYTDDSFLANLLSKRKTIGNKYVLSYGQSNTDLIITHNEVFDNNYEKLNTKLYSPILLFSPVSPNNYGLKYLSPTCYYYFDYETLIDGLCSKKKLNDIGISSKEEISLYIPEKGSEYYNAVIESIYYARYKNTNASYNEMEEKIKDVIEYSNKITNLYEHSEKADGITELFFGPEIIEYGDAYPIYDNENVIYTYNIYVKKDRADKIDIEKMFELKDIYNKYQLRSTTASYSLNNFTYSKNNLKCVEMNISESKNKVKNNE